MPNSIFDHEFWTSTPFGIVRGVFIVIDALLLFGIVYSLMKGLKFRPHFDLGRGASVRKKENVRQKFFRDRWTEIIKKFETGTNDGIRVAIIEADSLVDEALKQLSFKGEHFADRLEKLDRNEFKTLNRVWNAHRVRNDLVHTPGFFVGAHDAKAVLDNYEAFLRELGVM